MGRKQTNILDEAEASCTAGDWHIHVTDNSVPREQHAQLVT